MSKGNYWREAHRKITSCIVIDRARIDGRDIKVRADYMIARNFYKHACEPRPKPKAS